MTGMPARDYLHINHKDIHSFFKRMEQFDKDGCTIMASSIESGSADWMNGIICGHAYTVI